MKSILLFLKIKRSFLFGWLLLLAPVLASTQNWSVLNAPFSGRYDDIFFLNPALGWACNSSGKILHTVDSGSTWVTQTAATGYLRSIEFINADTGFCGGLHTGQNLLRTTDGGQTWQNITADVPGLYTGICGLSCPGGGKVYGCGVWAGGAYVIKSNDSGLTWEKINMVSYASALVDIFFITPDSGWVSGVAPSIAQGGIILSTSDGGQTWHTKIKTGVPEDYVWKIQTPDSIHFFASIERFPNSSGILSTQILKSSDAGASWELKNVSPQYFRLQMIGFIDSLTGFTGDVEVHGTSDGGESWSQVTTNTYNLNRFWRITPEVAFASGSGLYRYDNVPSASGTAAPISNNDIHQLSVSPNPTGGPLHVHVTLHARCNVLLKIVDLDGQGPADLVWSGEHAPGSYEFDYPLKGAPRSVLVWLKTDYGVLQRIVVLSP